MIIGRLIYTTTLASTPMQSPFTVADIFALDNVFADFLTAGMQQDIYMYWGYQNNDPTYDDQRNVSRSAAGVVEVTNFGSTLGFKFSISNVIQDRYTQVNEFEIISALNEELMMGTPVLWYPDYDNFPAEYYACVANKRIAPKRVANLMRYKFDFDLFVLPSVQIPSTVPAFVMA
jgi:hypothetical protein